MYTIPDPMFRRNGFGSGIKDLLSPDMYRVIVFGKLLDDDSILIRGISAGFESIFIG